MESLLECQKLVPVVDGELKKGTCWGQGDGGGSGGDGGGGGCGQDSKRKGYGSLEKQPSAAPGESEEEPLEGTPPAMRRLVLTCMCIPDSTASEHSPYEKYSSKSANAKVHIMIFKSFTKSEK